MPKDKVKGKQPTLGGREAAFKAAMGGLGLMIAAAGIPGQVRLASREQQRPPAFVPPKKRRGR
jgi:hypothetical protein